MDNVMNLRLVYTVFQEVELPFPRSEVAEWYVRRDELCITKTDGTEVSIPMEEAHHEYFKFPSEEEEVQTV